MAEARPAIVVVLNGVTLDGDTRYVTDLLRFIDRKSVRLHVVSLLTPLEDQAIGIQKLQVPVHSLDLPQATGARAAWWTFAGALTLMNLFRKIGPELVHTVGDRADLVGRWAARLARVPRVLSTQRHPSASPGLRRLMARTTAGLPDLVIAPTEALARDVVDGQGIHPGRIRVIAPGVDLGNFASAASTPDLEGAGPLVGVVARMDDSKGIDTLVDAAAILLRYHEDLRFVAVGSGVAGIGHIRRAQKLGLEDRFIVPGPRNDIPSVLAALDVFVLPARRDGLPLALLEALGAGVPCVATHGPSVDEALEDDVHALLCVADHPAFLADRIDRVLTNGALARRLADAGRALVQERFPAAATGAAHQSVYELLLET
ncbi:MAG: hypothetical protein CMJ83_03345 [Planctomycetes bacterium]|nr:hypothetical protein [Planctomycetota bacterium]